MWLELTCQRDPVGYQPGKTFPIRRPPGLLADGKYFTAPLPQYEKYDISQVVSIKDDPEHPVFGDSEPYHPTP
jgi:glucan 1,3-beta-glucosidase